MEQTEDIELVTAIIEKEEWAIAYLFKEYYQRFVLFANRYLNDYQESEEAVTDVFVAFWKTPFITFENLTKVRTYLYVCIKNKCSAILKNRNTKKGKVNRQVKQLTIDTPAEGSEVNFYHQIIYAEVIAEVNKHVSALPAGCEAICRMIFFEGRRRQKLLPLSDYRSVQ